MIHLKGKKNAIESTFVVSSSSLDLLSNKRLSSAVQVA